MTDEAGLGDLLDELYRLLYLWDLTHVAAARTLSDGHTLTVRAYDGFIEIEREDGAVAVHPWPPRPARPA
jgi:hypothetical protein